MKIRTRLAIACARLAHTMIRCFHLGSGASLPGAIARRIDPNVLSSLAPLIGEATFVVTGTNGKTTTTALLCQALRSEGKTVLCNETGANLLNGIISAYVLCRHRSDRPLADYACIEVDEIAARQVFPLLQPACIVLTNIFRDQLDRFGEVTLTCQKLQDAAAQVPGAILLVNCDDALSAALSVPCPNPSVTYGIPEPVFDRAASSQVRESTFCPLCGERLSYDSFHYGQLGFYHCPGCGWQRPEPDYTLARIHSRGLACSFVLSSPAASLPVHTALRSPCNLYNILAAYAALQAVRAPTAHFASFLRRFPYTNPREETFEIHGARVQLHLTKNPVGFQQKLSLLCQDKRPKDLFVLINDAPPDGRDISWLWDIDLLYLLHAQMASIVTAGSRRFDMALRLKYENIPCQTTTHIRPALKRTILRGTGNIYIFVNYSGLRPLQHMLRSWQNKSKKHRRAERRRP